MNGGEKNMPIFWCQERKTIRDLLDQECSGPERIPSLQHVLESRPLLVKSHCLKKSCRCILRQEGALVLKCTRDIGLIQGSWIKSASKISSVGGLTASSYPPGIPSHPEKQGSCVVLSNVNTTWFEVLNESGQAVPHWTQVREIVKYQPVRVLVRKDLKCIFARNNPANRTYELHSEDSGVIKAGSVLSYLEFNHFHVVKSRSKLKEVPLLKCCEASGHFVFLHPDDKCAISPVAGPDNISGVHSIQSVLQKFQLPIGIRPVLGGLAAWLPNSERHSLRLSNCFQNSLIFLEPLSGTGRFFVVTPDMLDDHVFSLGESESPLHFQLMDRHVNKVRQFLTSCHPVDGLQYLLRHMMDTSKPCSCPEDVKQRRLSANTEVNEDVHQLLDEIEEIYFYVRTGRFPSTSKSMGSISTLSRTPVQPSSRASPPDPPQLLAHYRSCHQLAQPNYNAGPGGCGGGVDQSMSGGINVSTPTTQMSAPSPGNPATPQQRSSSCDHLFDTGAASGEDQEIGTLMTSSCRLPPPPLPPRLYFTGEAAADQALFHSAMTSMPHTPRRPHHNGDYAVVRKPIPVPVSNNSLIPHSGPTRPPYTNGTLIKF